MGKSGTETGAFSQHLNKWIEGQKQQKAIRESLYALPLLIFSQLMKDRGTVYINGLNVYAQPNDYSDLVPFAKIRKTQDYHQTEGEFYAVVYGNREKRDYGRPWHEFDGSYADAVELVISKLRSMGAVFESEEQLRANLVEAYSYLELSE
jgi:hypothetical protein